ncbi:hypothetical protein QBC46DRAFT_412416 [Diplogelasinospora grovesii]|uniref:Uncharacterized protein n=1 Tax=Diplogelasinospora grovesii TaxID=303347 RepID=A0AAN6S0M8_9PEZI|nr:hypothetical protein QBC46DRAFT_412416 [Diplogelasinospora grovesii]
MASLVHVRESAQRGKWFESNVIAAIGLDQRNFLLSQKLFIVISPSPLHGALGAMGRLPEVETSGGRVPGAALNTSLPRIVLWVNLAVSQDDEAYVDKLRVLVSHEYGSFVKSLSQDSPEVRHACECDKYKTASPFARRTTFSFHTLLIKTLIKHHHKASKTSLQEIHAQSHHTMPSEVVNCDKCGATISSTQSECPVCFENPNGGYSSDSSEASESSDSSESSDGSESEAPYDGRANPYLVLLEKLGRRIGMGGSATATAMEEGGLEIT